MNSNLYTMVIDINSDIGESFGSWRLGNDAALLPYITSANIACGYHAGDPSVMQRTMRLAVQAGVKIGAHPGYPDLQGFGRRGMDFTPDEVEAMVLYQIGALAAFARAERTELIHVKPHGALYNQAAADRLLAAAVARAVARFSQSLILVGLAGSELVSAGLEAGLHVLNEGFPERVYNPDGSLRSRRLPGATIESPSEAAANARRLAVEGLIITAGPRLGHISIDTLCIHGDNPQAVEIARAVREALALSI